MKTSSALITVILSLAIASCSAGGNRSGSSYELLPDDDYRRLIAKAIINDDPGMFASLCRYPIEREYPLHDIEDSAMMVKYFPTLVDDSLKRVISESTPDDWGEFGWRGSSLADGEYIWCDEGVIYSIPYQSAREKSLLDSLMRSYYAFMPSRYASGWKPETCYTDSVGTVYRIDRKENGEEYLLTTIRQKDGAIDLSTARSLPGTLEIQGSAATHVYSFSDNDSTIWMIMYFPYEEVTVLSREGDGQSDTSIPLTKAYWHDMIRNKPY